MGRKGATGEKHEVLDCQENGFRARRVMGG